MTEFKRLRRAIAGEARSVNGLAIVIALSDVVIYAAMLAGFCMTAGPLRWIELGIASIMAGALFLIGHDASHQALAKSSWLNVVIAHIAFIPTLHPQIAWIIGHNRRHHAFTNLRGVDYVWTPWSVEDYRSASRIRRFFYRFYRTPAGIGFYYPLEIWLRHMWRTDGLDRTYASRRRVVGDRCIALGGFTAIAAGCFGLALRGGQPVFGALLTAVIAVAAPLVVYHFLMSIVIFMHHTHPTVRWFSSADSYDPLVAQTQDTIHVRFPKPVELLFHDIFQHTAHHLNPRVPLYRLARAQHTLEIADGPPIVQETFSLRYLLNLMRDCQLYDYDAKQWLTIRDGLEQIRTMRAA